MAAALSMSGRIGVNGDSAARAGTSRGAKPLPIWLAALVAARCQANGNGEDRAVRWSCVSGRALYTNAGADAEWIQPLGVCLERGETLVVYWLPGETDYTMEVYGHDEMCA
jgi:hypothetical protein